MSHRSLAPGFHPIRRDRLLKGEAPDAYKLRGKLAEPSAFEEQDAALLVTTTDVHLARSIGEAVHDAYQGELEFHLKPDENLLRVNWAR